MLKIFLLSQDEDVRKKHFATKPQDAGSSLHASQTKRTCCNNLRLREQGHNPVAYSDSAAYLHNLFYNLFYQDFLEGMYIITPYLNS
jgi:hypothetical protein